MSKFKKCYDCAIGGEGSKEYCYWCKFNPRTTHIKKDDRCDDSFIPKQELVKQQ